MRSFGISTGVTPGIDAAPIATRRWSLSPALLLSLALHLLPLLVLVRWSGTPIEAEMPIPVRLVIEQPPPAPAPRAESEAKPPPEAPRGRLASEEVGAPATEADAAAVARPPEVQPEVDPAPRTRTESEPELRQVASLVPPPSEPTLLAREALALPAPAIAPLPEMPAPPVAPSRPAPKARPPQRTAAITGPPAVRDEYLAYLVTLVRPYLPLLPPELLRGRRGTTSLAIRVLGDGTIARIAVAQSSGYPDIDARVVQIVAAAGRFPPLPPWIGQESWDINFHLRFPFPQAEGERR